MAKKRKKSAVSSEPIQGEELCRGWARALDCLIRSGAPSRECWSMNDDNAMAWAWFMATGCAKQAAANWHYQEEELWRQTGLALGWRASRFAQEQDAMALDPDGWLWPEGLEELAKMNLVTVCGDFHPQLRSGILGECGKELSGTAQEGFLALKEIAQTVKELRQRGSVMADVFEAVPGALRLAEEELLREASQDGKDAVGFPRL